MHLLPLLFAASGIVARANGEVVTEQQVADRLLRAQGVGVTSTPRRIVDDLVTEALVAQDGYAKGLDRDPDVVAAVEQARRKLAAQRFVAKEIDSAAQASDAQLLAMYHATADSAKVEVITLASEEIALATLERLRHGASVAEESKFAVDPEQPRRGGKPVTRTRADLGEELAETVFAAPLNTFVGPVKLPLGAAVVRVLERQIGSEDGFPAKQASLRAFVEQQLRHQAKTHFLAQLRKQAGIKLDEEFLQRSGTSLKLDGNAEHVVARVYGEPVRYAAIVEEVARLAGGKEGGHASGPTVKAGYAWAIVDQLLLEHEAMARGFGKDPALAAPLKGVERDSLLAVTGRRIRAQAGAPSDAEVVAYYQGHPDEFREPATRACAHIVVSSRGQADKLLASLGHGERFADLARDYSRDQATGANGGFLGHLGEAELRRMAASGEKALADALRACPVGKASGPVQSRMGWHILSCEAPTVAQLKPLDGVRAALLQRLTEQRAQQALARHADELRRHARVQIDEAAVAKLKSPTPAWRHP